MDPFANGVLLVGTGKALKLMQYFQVLSKKSYRARGSYQFSTLTGDCDGEKLRESTISLVRNEEDFRSRAKNFIGEYHQIPPYFSAVKHEGRPLYEWAREGVFINKPAVKRNIFNFEIISNKNNELEFDATVSSGTYIRGLWTDYCKTFELEGHLKGLTRTSWGDCRLCDCVPLSELEDLSKDIGVYLKRPQDLWHLPHLFLNSSESKSFLQGQFLLLKDKALEEYQWVFGDDKQLLGLGAPLCVNGALRLKCDTLLCDQ